MAGDRLGFAMMRCGPRGYRQYVPDDLIVDIVHELSGPESALRLDFLAFKDLLEVGKCPRIVRLS